MGTSLCSTVATSTMGSGACTEALAPERVRTMSSRTARTAPDAHTVCFGFRMESIFICYFSCTCSVACSRQNRIRHGGQCRSCRAAQRFLPLLTLSNLLETLSVSESAVCNNQPSPRYFDYHIDVA